MACAGDLKAAERGPNLVKNLLLVYGVSFFDLSLSLLVNILIPMIASKTDFANYRKIVLYTSYGGLMHLGLLSGMYLYVVGKSNQGVDWGLLSDIKSVLLGLQIIILPLVCVSFWIVMAQYLDKLIITISVTCWGFANFATFYNYLFQGINRFRVFFFVNLSVKVLSALLVCFIVLTKTVTTGGLVSTFVIPLVVTVILYEFVWKSYSKVRTANFQIIRFNSELIGLWRHGLVLYAANIGIALLFSIDNLLVSMLFSSLEFANYSFAYGLATVIYFAIDGLTAAVTPYLAGPAQAFKTKDASHPIYVIIVWLAPLSFWVSTALVRQFFSQYVESIPLLLCFSASLPFNILVRSRVVSIATATGKEKYLLRFALVALGLTLTSVVLSYLLFHSTYAVALGWSLAMIITGIAGVLVMGRMSGDDTRSRYRLVGNAIGATFLFALCATGGTELNYAITYTLGATFALGVNWYFRSLF